MNTFILRERALNDDTLYIADDGKVFSGGYVAILEYYTFLNAWNDRKHVKQFRKLDTMHKYLDKHYSDYQDEIWQNKG